VEFGRYYEDLEVGAVYRHWPGRTISEYDNTLFALVSMNQNPLFLDDEYARRQPLGRRPVIDTLVFSLAVGMSVADTTGKAIANLGYDSVIFERPLFPGDSLYAESEVLEKRESASKPDRGVVAIETRAYNQSRERILVLRRKFLAAKRNS
jgi:acyl dehydratase